MVLAMNVVGDGAAKRHELRAGRNRQKESARNSEVQNLRERNAGLSREDARVRIESEQAIHTGRLDERAVLKQANVAIAATHTDRQRAMMHAVDNPRKLVLPVNGT